MVRSEVFDEKFCKYNRKIPEYFLLIKFSVIFAVCKRIRPRALMTMNLFDQVSEDIKKAMLAREKVRLEALRGIKKEFLEAKTAKGANGELTDETAVKIMVKMVKQRKESAQIYTDNNRPELAANELAEAAVIEEYLPKQLSGDELDAELRAIIAETGATGPKEMGKVMRLASQRLAGRAEGKVISEAVKRLLN